MESLIKNIQNKNIKVNYINKDIVIKDSDRKEINEYWKTLPKYFTRGKIFVVNSIKEEKNNIEIGVYNSDYAHYIYVRRNPGKALECYNLWAGVLIETLDGKYVIGRMSKTTSSEGEYHISGGSCDKNDIKNLKIDYEGTMYRELYEEMGLKKDDLKNAEMKYMKKAFWAEQDIGIIYKAVVDKTSKQLEKHYKRYLKKLELENKEIEFDKLSYIDKTEKDIENFCLINKTPVFTKELLIKDIS